VLLFLTGGPGEPSVPFIPRIAKALGPVLTDYRLVVLSDACADTDTAAHEVLMGSVFPRR